MADVAVSASLQQWTFDKPRDGPQSTPESSPRLSDPDTETLRVNAAVGDARNGSASEALSLQDRYLSSEEDLSPGEDCCSGSECSFDQDADVVVFEERECFEARKMSVSRFDKGRSCDMAVRVSFVSPGRAKVIELATAGSPMTREPPPQRSASLAQLPLAAISKLRHQDSKSRLSLAVPFSHHSSALHDSSSASAAGSTRSTSPAVSDTSSVPSIRPASVAGQRPSLLQPGRSSLYISSSSTQSRPFPPLTPISPVPSGTPSFLSSDPYENSTITSASPIIKGSSHKRLRSISQKLALAKIAISPTVKKWDSRINGRPNHMPPTPITPYTPMTPHTAPPTSHSFSSPKNRLRRNSKISRPNSVRGSSPEMPTLPILPTLQALDMKMAVPRSRNAPPAKLVARGANEREPILELPPCPDEAESAPSSAPSSIKARVVRKRKSLMDLL